ncbi:Cytochrome P450 52A12 [Yarrowia sp. C11]|nr:Cytochrome P450 52A12 [Yarrowia sp. E02]KAG5372771.1 Cytochrome P450 52A12 [Yarrowia sp. C11]
MLQLFGVLVLALTSALLAQLAYNKYEYNRKVKKFGCGELTVAKNGFLGWKGITQVLDVLKTKKGPAALKERIDAYGRTYVFPIGPAPVISTVEPENIKAMLATQFKDFSLGTRYRALAPTLGDGIFTLDGHGWTHSRALLRPQFAREQVSRLDSLEAHFQILKMCIDKEMREKGNDSRGFDIQNLFFLFTLDSATEFLFGSSVDSLVDFLDDPSVHTGDHGGVDEAARKGFNDSFNRAQELCALRSRLHTLYWIVGSVVKKEPFDRYNKEIKTFVDFFAAKALKARKEKDMSLMNNDQYIFMYELVKETTNPVTLRDQMLNILLAGRDTTASMLSWIYFRLARDPKLYAKLREAVLEDFGSTPDAITFESLKQCDYLRYVLNEALRLYPVVPINGRTATRDTTLPRGGGPDQSQPIFIPKGQTVSYSVYWTHRDPRFWGEDAEEFIPERWDPRNGNIGRGWEYLPFNGGPRICLGQQFALTEVGYVLSRLVQTYETLETCDHKPLPPLYNHALTMCHEEGVWVKMYKGEKA